MADFEVRLKYILETRYNDCTNEEPALHQAVILNDLEVLRLFIKCKTDVNIVDRYGKLPIAYVKKSLQLTVLDLLLAAGSDIYKLDHLGMMQFSTAFRLGNQSIIKEYLKYKINLNMADSNGQTAIHYLMDNNCDDIMYDLKMCENFDIDVEDTSGQTPLLLAIENENLNWVKFLLEQRAKVDYVFERQSTLMYRWVEYHCDDNYLYNKPLPGCAAFGPECLRLLIGKATEINRIIYGSYTIFKLGFDKFKNTEHTELLKKLAIIETSGSSILEINLKTIEKQNFRTKLYYSEVKAELKRMRKLKLRPKISYFDILYEENMHKLANYFLSQRSRDNFENNLRCFHHFYDSLLCKYSDGIRRANIILKKEKMLSEIFHLKFPPTIIRDIAIYCVSDEVPICKH